MAPLKVLIIGSSARSCLASAAHLESNGYKTTWTVGAEKFIRDAGLSPPDIYLINLSSPKNECISIIKKIRAKYPRAGILVSVSGVDRINSIKAFLAGADNTIDRPHHLDEVLACIDSLARRIRWEIAPTTWQAIHSAPPAET